MIVVDSNVIVYLWISGYQEKLSEILLLQDDDWVAPAIWKSELLNVLILHVRHKLLRIEEAKQIIEHMEEYMEEKTIGVDSISVLSLTNKSSCSTYDCEFVALALKLQVPLVTNDKRILRDFPNVALSPVSFISEH